MRSFSILSVFVCAILFCSTVLGNVSAIYVLNEQYEVRGSGVTLQGALQTYYTLDSEPAEGHAPAGWSRADNFSVFADAFGDDVHNPTGTWASSQYVLNTKETSLCLNLSGYIWHTLPDTYVTARFMDVTSADMLYEYRYDPTVAAAPDEIGGNSYFDIHSCFYGLDTTHLYEFAIAAHAGKGDGGTALLNAKLASPTVMPTPSAFMLCGLGMCIVSKFRRKKV